MPYATRLFDYLVADFSPGAHFVGTFFLGPGQIISSGVLVLVFSTLCVFQR